MNKIIENLIKKFKIKHHLSLSYHLQINGLMKRFNKTLYKKLAKLFDKMD